MKTNTCATAVAAVVATAMLQADATIKIATIAPEGTPYVNALYEMGDAWKTRTNGRVTCAIFPATRGGEQTILRNLLGSAHSLQAAQLSAISLGHLDRAFSVFGLPMFFESYAEAERVLAKLTPVLELRLKDKDLKTLSFAFAGWVHVFSKHPVRRVADLKAQPLYTSSGDVAMAKWYSDNGFTPKQLDATQMLQSLKTGHIEATPAPPIFAHMLNWYGSAPNMMELGFAPLLGATVMSLDAWNRIPPQDQTILLEEAQKAGERLRRIIPENEKKAIEEMKKRKLIVTTIDAAEWRRMADQLAQAMLAAKLVPQDVYEIARRERDAVRAGK
jgi:TRAP-type C4-dicarboxylate transport system substrate-binding protein